MNCSDVVVAMAMAMAMAREQGAEKGQCRGRHGEEKGGDDLERGCE